MKETQYPSKDYLRSVAIAKEHLADEYYEEAIRFILNAERLVDPDDKDRLSDILDLKKQAYSVGVDAAKKDITAALNQAKIGFAEESLIRFCEYMKLIGYKGTSDYKKAEAILRKQIDEFKLRSSKLN